MDQPQLQPSIAARCCPRCQYAGEGIGYFRRPGHLLLLVGVSMLTYGVGGLVYWLARRRHTVCPSCGLSWEGWSPIPVGTQGLDAWQGRALEFPSAGTGRRTIGIAMMVLAVCVVAVGIVDLSVAIAVGGALGAAGAAAFYWGWRTLQERRKALLQAMERRVLRLATRRGGSLTVTEVAAELDLSLSAAERVLIGMDDGFRVRSEITDEGILLFEFPEVQNWRQLDPSGPSS